MIYIMIAWANNVLICMKVTLDSVSLCMKVTANFAVICIEGATVFRRDYLVDFFHRIN